MSKRRKYDIKNKRSFIIILILAIAIVGIFSLFIYNYSKASKIEYVIESGSVLQDVEKNYVTVDDDATLKVRWNGNYYLEYNDEKINLGKKVIVYNTIQGSMKLYGTFYEISNDGKIIENKNETILENTTKPKFYKIDDREYLLVDSKISSDDNSIQAYNYLLVELDKAGNAKLSNNKINLKTISPTKLVTSEYSFDIANELLNFGTYDIDLKKIIGSTNQYVPEDKGNDTEGEGTGNNEEPGDTTGSQTGTGTGAGGGTGTGNGIGTGVAGGAGDVVNNNDKGNVSDIGEIMDKIKMTSIIRVVEGLNTIDIDYVIYDPYNEYLSVYVEVISSEKIESIPLAKDDTHITIKNLNVNTEYTLNFKYTTNDIDEENGENILVPELFDRFTVRTKMPEYSMSVNKISTVKDKEAVIYRINLQKDFNISKVNVNLSLIDSETEEEIVSKDDEVTITELDLKGGYKIDKFDIKGYQLKSNTLLKLTVKSVVSTSGIEYQINSTYSLVVGR